MASRTLFRNVGADPDDPVETWPIEAMQTVLDRGSLHDWRRVVAAVRRDPWGPVSRTVEYVLSYDRPYGASLLLERAIAHERKRAEADEKRQVAGHLSSAVAASGLTKAEFAQRLGTSASRLSTYLSGTVTPSAAVLVRADRVASQPSYGQGRVRRGLPSGGQLPARQHAEADIALTEPPG